MVGSINARAYRQQQARKAALEQGQSINVVTNENVMAAVGQICWKPGERRRCVFLVRWASNKSQGR
ncbi:MAG: hypothetical protein ACR2Q4_13050, partial [Geminicoccaceae bacterium]